MGITPSFSPSCGIENSEKASLISFSSCAVIWCSLASFDWRAFGAAVVASAAAGRRFAGCKKGRICQLCHGTKVKCGSLIPCFWAALRGYDEIMLWSSMAGQVNPKQINRETRLLSGDHVM
jgi:hypothetical protein